MGLRPIARTAAVVALSFSASMVCASPGKALDPALIYASMVHAMNAQASPPEITYVETVTPHGLGPRIVSLGDAAVVHIAFSQDATPRVFRVVERTDSSPIVTDATTGRHYAVETPFWSPDWSTSHPGAAASPAPPEQSTVISTTKTRALADLSTESGGSYSITFAGVENIDGSPVYHLHLVANHDAAINPLTDVYVDETSYLVRRVIAAFTDKTTANVTGTVTLNFDRVGNYWLVTSGEIDATAHVLFKQVSGSAAFSTSNVAF